MNALLSTYTLDKSVAINFFQKNIMQFSMTEIFNVFLHEIHNKHTKDTYYRAFLSLSKRGVLDPDMPLGKWNEQVSSVTLDSIQFFTDISMSTKKILSSALLSFSYFLARKTECMGELAIRPLKPNRHGSQRTFQQNRSKSEKNALSFEELKKIFENLKGRKNREIYYICLMLYTYSRRLGEVLDLTWNDIDFENRKIKFNISKTRSNEEVYFSISDFMLKKLKELKEISKSNTSVFSSKANYIKFYINYISKSIGIHFSSHHFRLSSITHLMDSDIAVDKVLDMSCHRSVDTLLYYDKRTKDVKNCLEMLEKNAEND